jgi:centrosomal protein CEP164
MADDAQAQQAAALYMQAQQAQQRAPESVVLEEEIDPNYAPSQEEIREYATWLGMDVVVDADLLWVARDGLVEPLPSEWKPCKSPDGDIYYFNFTNGDSVWDHPCDERFKALYREEKVKKKALFETRATKRLLALGSSLSERLGADSAIPRELPAEVGEWIARHLRELPHAALLPAGGSSPRPGGAAAAGTSRELAGPPAEGVPPTRPRGEPEPEPEPGPVREPQPPGSPSYLALLDVADSDTEAEATPSCHPVMSPAAAAQLLQSLTDDQKDELLLSAFMDNTAIAERGMELAAGDGNGDPPAERNPSPTRRLAGAGSNG